MKLRYPKRVYIPAFLAILLLLSLPVIILLDEWLASFNSASVIPWNCLSLSGGFIAGISAVLTGLRDSVDRNSLAQTSPLSRHLISVLDTLVKIIILALLPVLVITAVVFIGSVYATNRGRLDFNYFAISLLFAVFEVFLGSLISRALDNKIIAPLFAFLVGIWISMYSLRSRAEINNWGAFDPTVYIFF